MDFMTIFCLNDFENIANILGKGYLLV